MKRPAAVAAATCVALERPDGNLDGAQFTTNLRDRRTRAHGDPQNTLRLFGAYLGTERLRSDRRRLTSRYAALLSAERVRRSSLSRVSPEEH